jgi:predicted Na+-dependent transporter
MSSRALPFFLALAAILGLAWPQAGRQAASWALPLWGLGGWVTVAIFAISGWHLDLAALRGRPWVRSSLAGMGLNLLLGPLLGAALIALLPPGWIGPDLLLGLAIMASVPTTLNTGLSIAISGGGDLGLAVLLTSLVTAVSAFVLPWTLPALLPGAGGLHSAALFQQMLFQVLLPLALGQWLRRRWPAPAALLWLPPLGVALSVWLAVSRHQGPLPDAAWLGTAALLFVALRGGLHGAALGLAARLKLSAPERRSFVIVGSQKSLVLAGGLLAQLPAGFDSRLGGAAFFCVIYHLAQAFWDSLLGPKA